MDEELNLGRKDFVLNCSIGLHEYRLHIPGPANEEASRVSPTFQAHGRTSVAGWMELISLTTASRITVANGTRLQIGNERRRGAKVTRDVLGC